MKRSKLVVLLLLLSLAFSSFVSVGVVSAENPWDADAPGSSGTSDTSAAPTTDIRPGSGSGTGFDAFQSWLVQVYVRIYFQATSYTSVALASDDGGKSQTATPVRK